MLLNDRAKIFILLMLSFITACVGAGDAMAGMELSGFVAGESRLYLEHPQWPGQESNPDHSILVQPELRFEAPDGKHQFTFIPYGRIDSRDSERTHFDMREAYWLYLGDDFEFLVGFNKVFWGVAESRHLVDIINQDDAVEDVDGEAKLGQPMLNLNLIRDWGLWEFYVMPFFRERTFVGEKGRFRSPTLVDVDAPVYDSGAEEFHPDVALRYSHYAGDWDFGLYHFYGTGREPRLIPNGQGGKFRPHYDLIHQTGLDIQYTNEAWLYKFEAIAREGQGDYFFAATGGFEYTMYQVAKSNADLGFLAEYHFDGRDSHAPRTELDNDIFAGMRLAFNNTEDTQILAGATYDPESDATFYNVEAQTRLTDHLKLEMRLRLFSGPLNASESLRFLENDDYLQIRLAYYI